MVKKKTGVTNSVTTLLWKLEQAVLFWPYIYTYPKKSIVLKQPPLCFGICGVLMYSITHTVYIYHHPSKDTYSLGQTMNTVN